MKKAATMKLNRNGFTLVELLVTMAVFIVVIVIAGSSFNTILTQASRLFRSEESNIEGIVGLEIMRHDIQQAGFGLFTEQMAIDYDEAASAPASDYNDASTNVPRPLVAGNNIAAITDTADSGAKFNVLEGTDYLVIKGTTVGRSKVSQKWTYLKYSSNDVYPNVWRSNAENLLTNDKVMLLRRNLNASTQTISVEPDTTGDFYIPFSATAFSHLTSASSALYDVYGVDNGDTLRMPFNRSDYFVARPQDETQLPAFCAPNVGVLYKTTVNQSNGKLNYVPILDCVADMQVVLGWDMNGDAVIDTYSNADGSTAIGVGSATSVQAAIANASNNSATTTDPNIRNNLKMVKIYILAQQGRRDSSYTSPSPILVGDADAAEISLTKNYDVAAAGWQNYRWKVYRIVSRPKNLPANQ